MILLKTSVRPFIFVFDWLNISNDAVVIYRDMMSCYCINTIIRLLKLVSIFASCPQKMKAVSNFSYLITGFCTQAIILEWFLNYDCFY